MAVTVGTVGLAELLAAAAGISPLLAVAEAVIALTPGAVATALIDLLGPLGRPTAVAGVVVVLLVAGAALGRIGASRPRIAAGAVLALAALAGWAAATRGTDNTEGTGWLAAVAVLAAGGAGAAALVAASRRAAAVAAPPAGFSEPSGPPEPSRDAAAPTVSRRTLVAGLGATVVIGAAGVSVGAWARGRRNLDLGPADLALPAPAQARPAVPAGLEVDGVSPLLTPNDRFYRIDTAVTVPRVDAVDWTLRVHGMVARPFALTLRQLLDMELVEVDVTLACVSNEVGGDLVGTARWLGVPLVRLLEQAGVTPGAEQVVGRSVDGWTAGFPLEAATDGRDAVVAVGMNGEPLPARHGFPARLVVPGLYGYVSATKWLSEIELASWDFDAYWVPRGWAKRAPIRRQSRIDRPRGDQQVDGARAVVAGVAWAPLVGVDGVELQVDDGEWQPAELGPGLDDATWRQWVWRGALQPGRRRLRVRCVGGDGQRQTGEQAPPRPDGATGWHTVTVTVV